MDFIIKLNVKVSDAHDYASAVKRLEEAITKSTKPGQWMGIDSMETPYAVEKANARLIAAAPELRDTLARLVTIAFVQSDIIVSADGCAIIAKARALLARLDGKAGA